MLLTLMGCCGVLLGWSLGGFPGCVEERTTHRLRAEVAPAAAMCSPRQRTHNSSPTPPYQAQQMQGSQKQDINLVMASTAKDNYHAFERSPCALECRGGDPSYQWSGET